MNIALDLTEEETDAINAAATRCGFESGEQWLLNAIVKPSVAQVVAEEYNSTVQSIGEAAKSLPYEERKALVAQVKAQLS